MAGQAGKPGRDVVKRVGAFAAGIDPLKEDLGTNHAARNHGSTRHYDPVLSGMAPPMAL